MGLRVDQKIVIVTRPTQLAALQRKFNTRSQAKFQIVTAKRRKLARELSTSSAAKLDALADGAACLGWAALTATLTVISYHATLLLASVWLFFCGVLAFLLALALWPMRRTRLAMLAWSIVQLSLAAFAAFDSEAGLFTLLYVGAGYAIAFGVFQIAAARWMRNVAMPLFEPTLPQHWLATRQA